MILSESELFTNDTSNDNHFTGKLALALSREVKYRHPTENLYNFFGLGLVVIVVIPKNQPLPKHLRKKRVKVRSTPANTLQKKDPLKVGACSANFIPILLKYFLNYQSQFLTTKRISFTTKRSKEN